MLVKGATGDNMIFRTSAVTDPDSLGRITTIVWWPRHFTLTKVRCTLGTMTHLYLDTIFVNCLWIPLCVSIMVYLAICILKYKIIRGTLLPAMIVVGSCSSNLGHQWHQTPNVPGNISVYDSNLSGVDISERWDQYYVYYAYACAILLSRI